MKEKHLIIISVLLLLLVLLGLTGAAGADAAAPSKSAAEYESEGYTVVYLSDTGYESKGFLVLDKGVTYLKETANGGISRSENRFSLSSGNFKKTSSPDGLDSIYNI